MEGFNEFMNFMVENWWVIIILAVIIATLVCGVIFFAKQPTSKKLEKIKEWLLFAVAKAEEELGSGTGQIKLRYVYDMFIAKFPWSAKMMSFEEFSKLVDEVLKKFNEMLSQNDKLLGLINGEATPTVVEKE